MKEGTWVVGSPWRQSGQAVFGDGRLLSCVAGLAVAVALLATAAGGCTPAASGTGSGGSSASGGKSATGGGPGTGGVTASGSGGTIPEGSGGTAATGGATGGASSGGATVGTGGAGTGGTPMPDAATTATGGSVAPRDASIDMTGAQTDVGGGGGGQGNGTCAGMFCEDFESGKIDTNVWNVKTSGGQTVVVQKTLAAHGMYAAQFHALPNVVSYDLLITKSAPAGLSGHHFGRAYFQVTPKPPAAHTVFLFAGSAGFPKFKYLEVASVSPGWQLTSVNLNGIDSGSKSLAGTTEAYSSGGTLPLAKWFCLEWEFNDAPDQIRVFVNGTEDAAFTNITLDGKTTGQVGGFADFGFGYYVWHPASTPFDIYYDDIVLDTKRVGCL